MRVLHINKFGWPKGGSDVYMLRACERLAAVDEMDVGLWAERPEPLEGVSSYDVKIPSFHELRGPRRKAAAAVGVLWSRKAARDLETVLNEFRPDVAHLHLYAHQFSSSILRVLHGRGIATVATAHDYKLVCPAYLATRRGHDCLDCAKRLSPALVRDACLHDSRVWSSVAFAEAVLVRRLRLVPNVVIAPSRCMHDRLVDSWLKPLTDIHMIRNPAEPSGVDWVGGGGYLLYVGRLSAEKGVGPLIEAVRGMDVPLRLVIAGDGPQRAELEMLAEGRACVEFTGHVNAERLCELRRQCVAQVVPSSCSENAPLAALEALVDGVPLIAVDRGGLPELFDLGARGALVAGVTPDALADALHRVSLDSAAQTARLRELRESVSWKTHLSQLVDTYQEVVARATHPDWAVTQAVPATSGVRG